jgi:hypothetical protein
MNIKQCLDSQTRGYDNIKKSSLALWPTSVMLESREAKDSHIYIETV